LNTLGDNSTTNEITGFGNTVGTNALSNAVSGANNIIGNFAQSNTIGGVGNNIAGGAMGDNQAGVVVHGALNAVNSFGIAGSNVTVTGTGNTVNGPSSGFNTISGHNAVVEGTGNFAGGGNATVGASVTGNDNVVIGAGASSVVDNAVVLGGWISSHLERRGSAGRLYERHHWVCHFDGRHECYRWGNKSG